MKNHNLTKLKLQISQQYQCQISEQNNSLSAVINHDTESECTVKIKLPDDNMLAFAMVQQITLLNSNSINDLKELNQSLLECCQVFNRDNQLIFGKSLQTDKELNLINLNIDLFYQIKSLFYVFLV